MKEESVNLAEVIKRIHYKCNFIDKSLLHKPIVLSDSKEWIMQVYSQFGFKTYEEIKEFSRTYNSPGKVEWMNLFYWDKEVEKDFIAAILEFYGNNKRKIKQVVPYIQELSLNWSPTNEIIAFDRNHKALANALLNNESGGKA